jgi:Concanavalin A-like lectin/glucanases superfamily
MISLPSLITRSTLSFMLVLAYPAVFAADVTGTLIRTTITKSPTPTWPSSISSPDPSGLAYLDSTGRLLDCDGEVDEMPALFTGDNLFEINLDGTLFATHSTTNLSRTGYSNEPTGCAYNSATGDLFISDDDQRRVFQIRPGLDGKLFTADDFRTFFNVPSVCGISDIDAEGVAYGAGTLFIIDGVGAEVWKVLPGVDGIFGSASGVATGETCTHFDTSGWVTDPEGSEYDTDNPDHLFVVGKPSNRIVNFTTAGTQTGTVNISTAGARKPAGLAAAPGSLGLSDPTPICKNLYIVDRGVDNDSSPTENDGKMYEISIPCPAPGTNQAPTVNAGVDKPAVSFSAVCSNPSLPAPCVNLDGTVVDDGLPTGSTVTTTWSKISGPGAVTFGNASLVDTTADFTSAGDYVLRLTASDSALSNSDDISVAVLPPPPTSEFATHYVSTVNDVTTSSGLAFADEDIIAYDTTTGTWSLYFDGSDVGLGGSGVDIDAFNIRPDGSILLSLTTDGVSIPGLGGIDDSDIVRFIPTSIGSTTAGTYEWYFDGSDVGLTANADDIDAIGFTPSADGGKLVVSTIDPPSVIFNPPVAGFIAADEDLLVFSASSLGATTSGTWAPYFDGSDAELNQSSSEDVNGIFIDSNADIYLTTLGAFSVTGASGGGDDIFKCIPGSTGSVTTCNYEFVWNGITDGGLPSGAVLDGIQLAPAGSNSNTAPTASISQPANGSTFTTGTPITFTGTAFDNEDAGLTGSSLTWTSSLNGSIGSGGSFTISSLSVGIHTIIASVIDSGGLVGSASVTVTVNPQGGGSNLTHQWKFDEISGISALDSIGSNNVTLSNSLWVTGKTGNPLDKAASFNGTNASGTAGMIDFGTGNFTVTHWVKVTGFKNYVGIFNNRSSVSDRVGFQTRTDGTSTITALIDLGASSMNLAVTNAVTGTWYHVAVTIDRAGFMKLYVTPYGSLNIVPAVQVDISAFSAASITNTDSVRIGRDQASNYFNGAVDDLRIYNGALSAAEIQNIYNQ